MDIGATKESSDFFVPYEVNSFMFKTTSGDDSSSEINISMRYFFKSQDNATRAMIFGFNPFFSYTGKYDFYWLPFKGETRPSSPVISRYQNPAFHFRYQPKNSDLFRPGEWVDIAFEHISNGQSLTANENRAAVLNAYQTHNNAVMDSISRTGAMLALTLEGRKILTSRSDLAIKWYVYRYAQEADVFWGRFANRSVNFNDFQRVKIQWRIKYDGPQSNLPWQFSAEMSIGSLGFSEDSWNFLLNTPVRILGEYEIPLAFSAHRGPMNTLSDYTRPQNTVAVGFTFAY